ncbi:hypothetical protein T492DRAFT_838279 [Pavlovales sp. CCMP2436]|nr:hypothetical protein T492DRAFT_838279 [Pavlovales sp. CCMP2436]
MTNNTNSKNTNNKMTNNTNNKNTNHNNTNNNNTNRAVHTLGTACASGGGGGGGVTSSGGDEAEQSQPHQPHLLPAAGNGVGSGAGNGAAREQGHAQEQERLPLPHGGGRGVSRGTVDAPLSPLPGQPPPAAYAQQQQLAKQELSHTGAHTHAGGGGGGVGGAEGVEKSVPTHTLGQLAGACSNLHDPAYAHAQMQLQVCLPGSDGLAPGGLPSPTGLMGLMGVPGFAGGIGAAVDATTRKRACERCHQVKHAWDSH